MSDLKIIKKKLLRENRVDTILEAIGCEHVHYSANRVEAQLPERFYSTNKRAVQVKLNDSLTSSIRTPVGFDGGDIYSLVSFLYHNKRGEDINKDLHESKKFICETLGWTEFLEGGNFMSKKDYVAPLKAILKGKQTRKEVKPNPVLSDDIMEEYYYKGKPLPFQGWIDEGISHNTQSMYGIGFCRESHRVVFPLKNRFGQIVGVKGRIMHDKDDDRKYLYLVPCQNRLEWFNFHYAHPYILMDKKVYIFESEKSPMKCFEHGIYNTLAIGSSEISQEQAQTIKGLGLDIEIILCYDKGIKIEEIRKQAEIFKGRKVSAIFDTDDLLSGKNSPIDEGIEIFNELRENYVFEIVEK